MHGISVIGEPNLLRFMAVIGQRNGGAEFDDRRADRQTIPMASIFSGVRSWTILGRFSIIYFRGLGLMVRVWVRVRVRLRVRVRVRVRVRIMVRVRVSVVL